jgi:hypothetical protein
MISKQKLRRTRISGGWCEVNPGWGTSLLTFKDYGGEERKEAVIEIHDPWQLRNIRMQLDKIAAYWDEKVKLVKP